MASFGLSPQFSTAAWPSAATRGRDRYAQLNTVAIYCAVWVVLFFVSLLASHQMGSFEAEFDGNSDEASHFMTSLLLRDYVVSGATLSPVQFAERHYLAYPKSAFGVWPPLFHMLAGGWFVLFEPSRTSAMLLMATLLSLTGMVVFAAFRAELGGVAAGLLALFLVVTPTVAGEFGIWIADALLVPLMLAATWRFARFLETHALRDSVWFGVFAALAFLTKYNAAALILVPVVGITLTRQWKLWQNPRLWAAPALVLAIAGPWYLGQLTMVRYAAEMGPTGFPSMVAVGRDNLMSLAGIAGGLGSLLALGGVWVNLSRGPSGNAAAYAGLLAGVWAMHSVLYPIVALRYLLPAAPAVLYFLGVGVLAAGAALQRWVPWRFAVAALSVLVMVGVAGGWPIRRTVSGWRPLTNSLRDLASTKVVLVSGSGEAEGALIVEMALEDRHRSRQPEWTVLRASKMLANSTWMRGDYQLRVTSPASVRQALRGWGVSVIAIDVRSKPQPHEELLLGAVTGSGNWREEAGLMDGVRVFVDHHPRPEREAIEVDLTHTLGRTLHRGAN